MSQMIDAVRRVPRAFARILAVAGLSLAAVAAGAPAASAQEGPEALRQMFSDPALANYRLTTANLTKFVAATQALKALEGQGIELEDRFDTDDDENISITAIADAFDSEPEVRDAINSAGMSTRDYVTFLVSTMQAMFGSLMVQIGGDDALANMPAGVLKQNIEFFLENQDAFEALDMDG